MFRYGHLGDLAVKSSLGRYRPQKGPYCLTNLKLLTLLPYLTLTIYTPME